MITVQQTEQLATFSGALTRATITRDFDKKYRKLINSEIITLDLAAISKIDTAGLAWILRLIELATKTGCKISLINLPDDLVKLAQLSAVDSLLPVDYHQ